MNPTTCVCLVRGINVGGRVIVRMEALRASFESLGCTEVRTHVQSGNVIFRTREDSAETLARRVEKRLLDDFGRRVDVFVLSPAELRRIASANPFLEDPKIDVAKLHVTFLSRAPGRAAAKALDALPAGSDRFHLAGRAVYLHCPGGYGRTKLSNNALERALSVRATTRNWRTVTTLRELAAGRGE